DIQKRIASKAKLIEEKIKELAQNVLREIERQGFDTGDFPRQTLPNHFQKLVDGEFSPKNIYTSKTLESNLVEEKLLKAADKRDVSSLSAFILEHYLSIKQLLYRHSYLKNV